MRAQWTAQHALRPRLLEFEVRCGEDYLQLRRKSESSPRKEARPNLDPICLLMDLSVFVNRDVGGPGWEPSQSSLLQVLVSIQD